MKPTTDNPQPIPVNPKPTTDNLKPRPTNEILVKAEGLSKKFCKDLKTSLWYGVKDLVSGVTSNTKERQLRPKEFWAVKDINFELRRGECLGLIGHNGAGKSTLLKILNGLINPDAGKVTIKGRVGALIELGAGFNPILSGRENIYNNGAVLGFSKKEIDAKVEDVIDFAEIREFIDMPVRNYSSGMKVRLGFAVAAQMEPDVLIIDEVLAVGDIGFRIKCMNRIQELMKSCCVIFVSHSMAQVSMVSTSIILLDKGGIEYIGDNTGKGIEKYLAKFTSNNKQILSSKNVSLIDIKLSASSNDYVNDQLSIHTGEQLMVEGTLEVKNTVKEIKVRLGIFNIEQRLVAEVDSDQGIKCYQNKNGIIRFKVAIDNLHLRYGKYTIHLHVTDCYTKKKLLRHSDVATFLVKNTLSIGADFLLPSDWTVVDDD